MKKTILLSLHLILFYLANVSCFQLQLSPSRHFLQNCGTRQINSLNFLRATSDDFIKVSTKRHVFQKALKSLKVFGTGVFIAMVAFVGKAQAQAQAQIVGFDLFGRMPHDDWLFKTSALIDKNFLKPTIVEAVLREMPDVCRHYFT